METRYMYTLEKIFSFGFVTLIGIINPIKKKIIKTEGKVHKFINNQSLLILKNDGHRNAYKLISKYINDINIGAVWADLDLKSSNHFYNPYTKKGLYGNGNAKTDCMSYYSKALIHYASGNYNKAMFYLGAACHLIQDLTVPQHANVMLFSNHRSYEKWVIKMYRCHDEFKIYQGGIYFNKLNPYIILNTKKAISTYNKYTHIKNQRTRFYKITSVILVMAQKTTAGLMYKFYKDIQQLKY